jgi:hypothetical protein
MHITLSGLVLAFAVASAYLLIPQGVDAIFLFFSSSNRGPGLFSCETAPRRRTDTPKNST